MFVEREKMRSSRTHQPLTYDVCLPNEAQADALRLLDATRDVCNQTLEMLWPYLDEFGCERTGPAWKQVGAYIGSPQPHGDRQWRCESEVVGTPRSFCNHHSPKLFSRDCVDNSGLLRIVDIFSNGISI